MTKDVKNTFREESEPAVRSGAVYLPMWLIGFLGIMLYWGCNYIDERGGRFSAMVYEPYLSEQELRDFVPQDEIAAQMRLGGLVYNNVCGGCHQAHGGGNATQAPSLVGSEWVLATGPNRLIRIPAAGLTGPIKVNGAEWNMGTSMPAVAGPGSMTDEQLAAVLTYIRNSWGNKAPAVTVEQVEKVRAEVIKNHPDMYTAEELLKLSETP